MTRASDISVAIKVGFLTILADDGIALPPEQADAAAAEFLVLDRHMQLIRGALAMDAGLPLGFAPPPSAP